MRTVLSLALLLAFEWPTAAVLACTCRRVSIEEQARAAQVVAVADVIGDRVDADKAHVALLHVVEALRGLSNGQEAEVRWVPSAGQMCPQVDLHKGRWLLFLRRDEGGQLTTSSCDLNSMPLSDKRAAHALKAVRAVIKHGPSERERRRR